MKPKKQIDFIIEEFFNTGKLNLNKEEEGITFDQLDLFNENIGDFFSDADLEKLKHERPSEDETSTVDTRIEFLNKSIKDAEEEFTSAIKDAIEAEQEKDFPAAKKFYQQALSTLNRLSGYSKDELYKGIYGKKDLDNTIERAKAPLGGIGVYNWTQLKNDIARTGRGEKIDVDDEDILSILDIEDGGGHEETSEEGEEGTEAETSEDVVEDEVDITSMQKQISKWKSVELDDATIKVLETYLPKPENLEKLEKKIEELKKDGKRLDIWEKQKLKSLYSQIKALKDQQKIVARTIIENPCIINSIIYRNPGNLQYFKPLMDKLVNIFDKKVNTKGSKLYKALMDSNKVPDKNIMPFLNNIAHHKSESGGGPQTQMDFDIETTKFCGVEVLEKALKGKSFGHTIQEPIRKEINPTENPNIQKWLDHAIDMAESIFNHIVSNKVFVQTHATRDKYEKLLYIIQKYSSGENESEIIEQLTHVAFDLKEMDEMIRKYDLGSPTTQQNITNLINKIFDSEESNNIKDNLRQIRISRNKQYELSFTTCVNPENGTPYFTNEKGGDSSTILRNPNWAGEGSPYEFLYNNTELKRIMDLIFESEHLNSFGGEEKKELQKFIQGKKEKRSKYPMLDYSNIINTRGRELKIKEAAQLLFNNIHPSGIKKYDIKADQDVRVTRGSDDFTILDKSLVEVKLTTEYDYHLSEFFGVYKSSEKRLASEYRDYPQYGQIYGDIIEELYRLMTTGEGKKKGDEILATIKGNTAGIFFEYYKYANMDEDVILKWDLEGQRKTEKRLAIRCVVDESKLYTWHVGELECADKTFLPIVDSGDVIDDYISEALGF